MSASVEGGIRFGQYVLLRRIARGGMAEVFLAQQRGLEGFDRRVAVKRILPHLADSPDFVRMFLGEAKLVAQLTHPNIVHIYDFGKHEGDYFIAMEFVDGVHAGQLYKFGNEKERIPPTLVARIGADAATALHYAHELRNQTGQPLGLVHRDVSPANIMVSFDGVVKLCDFGIAKAAAVSDQLTNPGQVKGKYAYMSPEQTIASPLDGRSDVFSLAICMWELLAGKTIVGRGDAVDAMRTIRDGRLEPIAKAAPKTPPALAKAITWALQTRREIRATAMDFAQALEAFIKSSPELATPMQLGGWIRQRFVREGTGQHAAMPGVSVGTKVSPGTLAGPQTPETPGTAGTSVAEGTKVGTITPPSELIAASKIKTDEDILETAETIAITGETTDEKLANKATVLDAVSNETVERNSSSMIVGQDTIAETEMRSGAFRPQQPAGVAVVPTIVDQPRVAKAPTIRMRTRGPADSQTTILQRIPRRVIAMVALLSVAVVSFLIALAVWSPSKSTPSRDASVVAVAPDAAVMAPLADAADPSTVIDAREPTVRPDAPSATTSVLEIRTKPPGGVVRVSGEPEARADPARFALPPGAYTITAELDGYRDETRDVLMDGRTDVVQDLIFSHKLGTNRPAAKTGKLSARTNPYSVVWHGNKRLGETPFADKELPVGKYVLTFRHPDHKAVTRTVTISANKTAKLSFNLP